MHPTPLDVDVHTHAPITNAVPSPPSLFFSLPVRVSTWSGPSMQEAPEVMAYKGRVCETLLAVAAKAEELLQGFQRFVARC